MPFEPCSGCGHLIHIGKRCVYPKHLFSTPGTAPVRCGCRKTNAGHHARATKRNMKRHWKDGRHFRQQRSLDRLAGVLGSQAVDEQEVALVRKPIRVRCGACGWRATWIGGASSGRACRACRSTQMVEQKRLRELRDLEDGRSPMKRVD